jgi:hypothetical protein
MPAFDRDLFFLLENWYTRSGKSMPETLEELLARMAPSLEVVFGRRGTPPAEVTRIVGEALEVLNRKRRDIENPDAWLLEMVERQLAGGKRR